jgi:hypothetical protein
MPALPSLAPAPRARAPRSADPWRDLAVIDARAPRLNQLLVGLVTLTALLTGAWPLLGLLALQLVLTLRLGRRWCLACRLWFDVLQPRLGEGPLEDARPVRFANQVGATFLGGATLAYALGWPRVGLALAATVAVLALVASLTGICAGCLLYRGWALLRGVRGGSLERLDLSELGCPPGEPAVVAFSHPLCADCQDLARRLEAEGRAPVTVDVSRRPDLARKYGVAVVPLAVSVGADGRVLRRIHAGRARPARR